MRAARESLSCADLGRVWHEYIASMIMIQAMATALATLVWLMLTDAVGGD